MYKQKGEYLKVKELEVGKAYECIARNFDVGVWEGEEKGFKYMRLKFRDRFIDYEYHYDTDPKYGTAQPLREVPIPEELV